MQLRFQFVHHHGSQVLLHERDNRLQILFMLPFAGIVILHIMGMLWEVIATAKSSISRSDDTFIWLHAVAA